MRKMTGALGVVLIAAVLVPWPHATLATVDQQAKAKQELFIPNKNRPVLIDLTEPAVLDLPAARSMTDFLVHVGVTGRGDMVFDDPTILVLRGGTATPAPGEDRALRKLTPAEHDPPLPDSCLAFELPGEPPYRLHVATLDGRVYLVAFLARNYDGTTLRVQRLKGGGDRPSADSGHPLPAVWKRHAQLKEQHDAGLVQTKEWLTSLEPDAFAAKFPGVTRLLKSEDKLDRLRAIRALGALREPSSIPVLVAHMGSDDHVEELQAAVCLSDWVYGEYNLGGRRAPEHLAHLLPLFVQKLLDSPGEPNVRARCCQVIGCLAGPEWLPWLKEMAGSKHDAVKHWAGWAVQEMTRKYGEKRPD